MEKDNSMDDNLIKRSDPIIASKSVGSFVKIDSISIDLDDANDDNSHAGKCEHFSIRGYVSEIRKKNWKICWPFALDGDSDKSYQEKTAMLPPLDAPKFRSWCCQNCLREIGSKNVKKGHGTDLNCHVGSNSKYTGAQMPPTTDAALLQSDCHQVPKSKIVEEKQFDAYTYTIVDGSETHHSSRIDKKKRNAEVSPTTIIVNENGLEDYVSHERPRFSSAEAEVNTSRMPERHKYVTEKLKCNESVKVCKPGCENHEDTSLELEITKNKCWIRNSTEASEIEYQSLAGDKQESINAYGPCKARMIDEAGNAIKVQANVCCPLILDESDNASSENHEKSSGFHRKKSRKVRLLTELLCNNEDAKTAYTRAEDSPSNMINNTSEAGSVSHGQVSLQENVRVRLGENKKRKVLEEEEKGSQEMSHPKIVNKKVKTSRRDGEAANGIAGTGLEEDAFARISLQADMKNNWIRYGNERIPTVSKKKAKKSHDFDAWSSLVPTEENVPIEAQDKFGSSSKGIATTGASFRLVYDPSTVGGIHQIPLYCSKNDRKSGFVKRKGKMPQSDTGQASLLPCTGMPRKDSNTRKDAEIKSNGQGTVPFHLAEDASTEKGLDLSLDSYLAAQRYDSKCLPQHEDGFPSLSTWKDSTCKLDEFMRKNVEVNYLANLNKPSTSIANPLCEEGVHGEPSKKVYTYSMPILNEKQNDGSQVEQGSCSLMQQMDISRASKNQNIIEVEKNSGVPVSRKHSNHRADKMSDKGTIDDIPMEIVELMAKNQYERCRHETENNKHVLETLNKARNGQVMEHSQVYDSGDLRVLEETNQKRKAQARNAKNGITKKNVAPVQQKSVDYFSYINGNHFSMNRLDQMHCPTGFGAFNQSQKKPSPRGQFPAAGNSKCSCAQSCKWDGNMMGHGFSNSNLQSFAACNTCQSVPQSKEEAAHLWSPVISAHMPFAYKNPQKGATQPSNVKILSHSPGPLQKGNANGDCDLSLNLNAPNFEKRNEAVGSETISRTHPEHSFSCKRNGTEPHQNSMGSLDLYSNETIPAMHLLSLMDAGMRSGAPLNMGGNPKFPKRPFSSDLNSKGYPGLDIGLYKATDTVNHPSSNCYGKNHLSEKSLDLFPTNPTFGASTSSFEHSKGFGRATEFMGQVSSSQKKEKIQRSHSPAQIRGPRSQKSLGTDGVLGNNHTTIPIHSIPKGFLPVSGPMMFPLHYHTIANSRQHNLEAPNANGTMKPPKSSSESSICCINRNPADFSMPDVGNGYMIRGEDLKFGKKNSSEKRHGLFKVDQQKRQRITKYTTEKDRARH